MSDKALYTVDKKDEIRRLDKGGAVETWYRIYATSLKGTYFHVEVHEDNLASADLVLTDRARQLDSIQ